MLEATFRGAARTYYDPMSPVEQASIDRVIARLEHEPAVDGVHIFGVPGAAALFLHDDGAWQIAYAIPDDATLVIRSIAHALDLPA